jgi:hypothetical protein
MHKDQWPSHFAIDLAHAVPYHRVDTVSDVARKGGRGGDWRTTGYPDYAISFTAGSSDATI